ncbi:hypothetical protein GNI_104240 [Gregarina niphandrodes]|uniref:Uncharacterized protein n=1 Tax=Gregarina niphandrodes TaxID=110365 RepID=A0A023B447_GRENI|nr:hypothetical protein GNI_104240 [Gregarina niphandrodes]EZG56358.1 hypothetical protein GNI_104240 [Gregarina niphandrodes]|eukprot:XP_011131287.1 hypothetical protein GNI_104240 [Gregarina niphandrodes]
MSCDIGYWQSLRRWESTLKRTEPIVVHAQYTLKFNGWLYQSAGDVPAISLLVLYSIRTDSCVVLRLITAKARKLSIAENMRLSTSCVDNTCTREMGETNVTINDAADGTVNGTGNGTAGSTITAKDLSVTGVSATVAGTGTASEPGNGAGMNGAGMESNHLFSLEFAARRQCWSQLCLQRWSQSSGKGIEYYVDPVRAYDSESGHLSRHWSLPESLVRILQNPNYTVVSEDLGLLTRSLRVHYGVVLAGGVDCGPVPRGPRWTGSIDIYATKVAGPQGDCIIYHVRELANRYNLAMEAQSVQSQGQDGKERTAQGEAGKSTSRSTDQSSPETQTELFTGMDTGPFDQDELSDLGSDRWTTSSASSGAMYGRENGAQNKYYKAQTEQGQQQGSREEGSREEGAREEGSRGEGSRGGGSREEGSREEGSREEGTRGGGSREEGSRGEGSRGGGSRGEGQKEEDQSCGGNGERLRWQGDQGYSRKQADLGKEDYEERREVSRRERGSYGKDGYGKDGYERGSRPPDSRRPGFDCGRRSSRSSHEKYSSSEIYRRAPLTKTDNNGASSQEGTRQDTRTVRPPELIDCLTALHMVSDEITQCRNVRTLY